MTPEKQSSPVSFDGMTVKIVSSETRSTIRAMAQKYNVPVSTLLRKLLERHIDEIESCAQQAKQEYDEYMRRKALHMLEKTRTANAEALLVTGTSHHVPEDKTRLDRLEALVEKLIESLGGMENAND